MPVVVGIDLGTTNSAVAVWNDGEAVVIRSNAHQSSLIPSYVCYKGDQREVGWAALKAWDNFPTTTIFGAKRFIGRPFEDPDVQEDTVHMPYKVVEYQARCGFVVNSAQGRRYVVSPEEVSAAVLSEVRRLVEDSINDTIRGAVITVPANFNNAQREATLTAAKIAGIEVISLLNEPTAAALYYGVQERTRRKVCIFDFGGGSFDVTVMEVSGGGNFTVLATGGNNHLGGANFDARLAEHFIHMIDSQAQSDEQSFPKSPQAFQRLCRGCKELKESLAHKDEDCVRVTIPMNADGTVTRKLDLRMKRSMFESITKEIVAEAINAVKRTLEEASVHRDDINDVVLVGGTCRVLQVQRMLQDYFGKVPFKNINPDEVVACGACLRAAHLLKAGVRGVQEVVDVIPLSLGVALPRDVMGVILPRNTRIPDQRPLEKTVVYRTVTDNQTLSRWVIYQGENNIASLNFRLGQFSISNLPPRKKGKVSVAVTFSFDPLDGTLSVGAAVIGHAELRTTTIIEKPYVMDDHELDRLRGIERRFYHRAKEEHEKDTLFSELEELCLTTNEACLEHDDTTAMAPLAKYTDSVSHWCQNNEWASLDLVKLQMDELRERVSKSELML